MVLYKNSSDGYLQIDTEMNYTYEVPVRMLIIDNNFINHLIDKIWFNEELFFELINKLKLHNEYKNFDFTKIIFSASEKFFIIKMCKDDDLYNRVIWFRSLESLSNTF
jgi:hypothetical protein